MKRIAKSALALAMVLATPALAHAAGQKLLLTEIVALPAEAEYIEIHNPGSMAVDLSNYYLADYQTYYQVVIGSLPALNNDFLVRFPAGATIQPGEYQTIATGGGQCFFDACGVAGGFNGFGFYPTYELPRGATQSSALVPDMVEPYPASIGAQAALTDAGEIVVLFYWDGMTDLVSDADYVYYGQSNNSPVNKTGVSIDGPDTGVTQSTYLPDTPDDPARHAPLFISMSSIYRISCRTDNAETGQVMAGGNGVAGADETSEDLSQTWFACTTPSPNEPTMGVGGGGQGGSMGQGGSGGQGGAGGASSTTTTGAGGAPGTTGTGGAANAGSGGGLTVEDSGCGCRTAGAPSPGRASLVVLAVLAALLRRRIRAG